MVNFRVNDFATLNFERLRLGDLDDINDLEVGDYLTHAIPGGPVGETTIYKCYEIIHKTNKRLTINLFEDDLQFNARRGKPVKLSFQGDNVKGLRLWFWYYCKKNYIDTNINEWVRKNYIS